MHETYRSDNSRIDLFSIAYCKLGGRWDIIQYLAKPSNCRYFVSVAEF